jgi:phage terminase small subunit
MAVQTKQRPLTMKQRLFVEEYIQNNGNGTQAAIKAGYKGDEYNVKAIASRNLTKSNIKALIDKKKAEIAEKYEITRDNQVKKLERVIELAEEKGDMANVVAAIREENRLAGLITEKIQDVTVEPKTFTDKELEIARTVANRFTKMYSGMEDN